MNLERLKEGQRKANISKALEVNTAQGFALKLAPLRSGTVIEYKPNQAIDEFSNEFKSLSDVDKFDVFCVYQWLVVRSMPKKVHNPSDYDWWESRLTEMDELTGEELIKREKSEANIRTSYEMVQFGKKMVTNFWRES